MVQLLPQRYIVTVLGRDLRSFVIRFDFESYVRFEIRFTLMVRFEIFESSVLSIVIRKETLGGAWLNLRLKSTLGGK